VKRRGRYSHLDFQELGTGRMRGTDFRRFDSENWFRLHAAWPATGQLKRPAQGMLGPPHLPAARLKRCIERSPASDP